MHTNGGGGGDCMVVADSPAGAAYQEALDGTKTQFLQLRKAVPSAGSVGGLGALELAAKVRALRPHAKPSPCSRSTGWACHVR